MKKRTYRKISVKEIDAGALAAELGSGRVVFAIDVAKVDMVAAIVAGDGRVLRTVCWRNPVENELILGLLSSLQGAGLVVEAVMESSGTSAAVAPVRSASRRSPLDKSGRLASESCSIGVHRILVPSGGVVLALLRQLVEQNAVNTHRLRLGYAVEPKTFECILYLIKVGTTFEVFRKGYVGTIWK